MPHVDEEDDDDDHFDEREYPDDDEADWNLDPATHECPLCGEEISEDAQQCPHCKEYISKEDAPREGTPLWIKIGLILLILIVISWLFNWK